MNSNDSYPRRSKEARLIAERGSDQGEQQGSDSLRSQSAITSRDVRKNLQKERSVLGSYRKGGKVPQTGVYRLHKGERVITASKVRKLERKSGRR